MTAIPKAIQAIIEDGGELCWVQSSTQIFLCRVAVQENGREVFRKLKNFYVAQPGHIDQAIRLHHAVFDAVADPAKRPILAPVLERIKWQIEDGVQKWVAERERERARGWE